LVDEDVFPWDPITAIKQGFKKAEAKFLQRCQAIDEKSGQQIVIEKSGSCAIVVLIVGDICYVANVGDSRAVLSTNQGSQTTALSRDHKPSDANEY
jgi:protein phosphatase PTC2/3